MKTGNRMIVIFFGFLFVFTGFAQSSNLGYAPDNVFMNKPLNDMMVEEENDWWPMFQHDLKNTGFSMSTGPETNQIAWMFHATNKINDISIVDERIYFGTQPAENSGYSKSYLYCLDMNGNLLWRVNTTGDLDSTPAIVDNNLYVCSGNGKIYCFETETGSINWMVQYSDYGLSSPAIVKDRLVFSSMDGKIYCLNMSSGELIWSTSIGLSTRSTPVIVNDSVFSCNYCIDLESGNIIWQSEIGIVLLSSPVFFQNKIYIGSRDEKIYCLDAMTGRKLWRFYTGSMTYQYSPATAYGNIYVGNAFGFIYCIDATTGEYIWSEKNSARAVTSPAVCDGKIYIGSIDNKLYCLDAYTGENIWSYQTKDAINCNPVIVNNMLYVGSGNTMYCFGSEQYPNLETDGSLHWTNVLPGSVVKSNITIKNVGDDDSSLDWRVERFPDWGNWTFSSMSGQNLKPDDTPISVEITISVPKSKSSLFNGEIKIVNTQNATDYEILDVTLSTSKNKMMLNVLINFLKNRYSFFFS